MSKIPLLLLPGLLTDARLFRDQLADLADIADPTVADLTQDDSVTALAARALAAAPRRFALAGLSMGGYVALEIMRQAPERVTHLALLDTSAKPDTEERKAGRRALIAKAQSGGFNEIMPDLAPKLLHPDHLASPLRDEVIAMADGLGPDVFVRQSLAILGRPDSRPTLAGIRTPSLVIVGAEDQLTPPAEAQELHQGIRGSRLEVIAVSGHLSAMEQPSAVSAAMRAWLSQPAARQTQA